MNPKNQHIEKNYNSGRLIAHRFQIAGGKHPENSLAALKAAIAAGANAFEFDVMMSRDGELLINHDWQLGRIQPQLKGQHFLALPSNTLKQHGIASLEEIFECVAQTQLQANTQQNTPPQKYWLNIEIKTPDETLNISDLNSPWCSFKNYQDDFVNKLSHQLRQLHQLHPFDYVVSSFDFKILFQILNILIQKNTHHETHETHEPHKNYPRIALLAHTAEDLVNIKKQLKSLTPKEISYIEALHFNHLLLNSEGDETEIKKLIDEIKAITPQNLPLRLYTVNSNALAQDFLNKGYDVFTDIFANS